MYNMKKYVSLFLALSVVVVTFTACNVVNSVATTMGGYDPNNVEQDKELGTQMYAQIASDQTNYPLLDEKKYATAYQHIQRITNTILNSGVVEHRNDFDWSVKIVNADNVQNAFACPGGKLYVYTGLIKYLDNEAQLAGVMAHEIAHAAARHSSKQIAKSNTIDWGTSLALGKNPGAIASMVAQIAGGVGNLAFSRSDESEADALAVYYLSNTDYNPLGVAGFFQKLQAEGQGSQGPTFLSTHPSSSDRIQRIQAAWQANGSKKGNDFVDRYKQVKASLNVK